ncbi:hypothetical protein [Meiothermus taiwanensis]|jgi:hypothetical protein|uniref:Cytochrome b561 bacterial/Ni-hydrogenase domain-containing protein n=2 Tax=Meiothermus taiwanensis TaxID=172827 RepID=A0A399E5U6_9DEIN|nr:hypothetical protein [Meiothermus taiwanensis]AWR85393.1 hypothetical protein Mtai_v1c01420 [Meiothermus taiwanensis WR-220]KIQ55280.1 hypothetical protein SY28_04385 [Meiothermus taiwanensis]KZK16519.1 hypothetical protein A3962_05795 [Meiothermus taiwanensis]RIH78120.1 hypothetical protein Mcate_01006 [Meiothermus taiwanensis]
MYEFLLSFHNIARWLVLLAAAYLIYRSVIGLKNRVYTATDRRAGQVYTGLIDLQLLLGVLLMLLSPFVQSALNNPGAAMQNSQTRFFIAEHWVLMLAALVLAHIGGVRSKKATDALLKHRQALIWYGSSLALVLLAIPWWRPLLRLG